MRKMDERMPFGPAFLFECCLVGVLRVKNTIALILRARTIKDAADCLVWVPRCDISKIRLPGYITP